MSNLPSAIIKAKIDAYFYANGIKKITGPEGNELYTDLLDSLVHFDEDYIYLNLQEYSAVRTYKPGETCVFNFVIYQNSSTSTLNNNAPESTDPSPWVAITDVASVLGEFAPYDNATAYVNPNTVRFSNKLYLCIAPTTGNAPPNGLYWQEVSPSSARFGRIWETNTYYADKQVVRHLDGLWQLNNAPGLLSVDLLDEMASGLWSPLPNVYPITLANLRLAIAGNQVAVNRLYLVTDHNVFLMGLTQFAVGQNGWLLAKNPDYQKLGDYSDGYGNYLGDWSGGLTPAIGDVVKATEFSGEKRWYRNLTGVNSNPALGGANWETVQRGFWSGVATYNVGDAVIYELQMYRNLTGAVGTAPDSDGTNWEPLDPMSENSYIDEVDEVTFDIAAGYIISRKCKRGNCVSSGKDFISTYNPIGLFQWGNDAIYNNTVVNALLNLKGAVASVYNNKLYGESRVLAPVPVGAALANCEFGLRQEIDLDGFFAGAITDIKIVNGYSNFRVFLAGSSILDFGSVRFAGIIVLTGGATTIDEFANIPVVPFKIYAEDTETFDINSDPASCRLVGAATCSLVGSNGDFIEFGRAPVGTFLNIAMEQKRVIY